VDKFYYTVKDKNGAVSNVDTVCINVMETFEIPSGFTPNNDGKNDMWQIKGLESYPDNEVVIFNRWGNEVFKTAGYSAENAWTGSELNAGTYYYIIRIRVNETEKTFTGYVTLIR
jgi:large repetitive protein